MTLQSIGPRQWRGNLFPPGRAMLAALLIGGVPVAQAVATALRGVLSLGGARHLFSRWRPPSTTLRTCPRGPFGKATS